MQAARGEARQKGTGSRALASIFYHLYLSALSTFPYSLAELSPGAPALFSEAAAHLKKLELETVKAAGPWPALHININKVPRTGAGQ